MANRYHINQALIKASLNGDAKEVALLLVGGANPNAVNGMPLSNAAARSHLNVMKVLLEAGANDNLHGGNSLQAAAYNDHIKAMKMLLKAGADASSKYSALWNAVYQGQIEAVKLLIKEGVDVHHPGKGHPSVFEIAESRNHLQILELLRAAAYKPIKVSFEVTYEQLKKIEAVLAG